MTGLVFTAALFLASGFSSDFLSAAIRSTTFDPLGRAGLGYKIPLSGLGLGAMSAGWFTTEFRMEMHFEDEAAIVAGIVAAYSYFL